MAEFGMPARVIFGRGTFAKLGALAAEFGRAALVVTNADRSGKEGLLAKLETILAAGNVRQTVFMLARHEPDVADVGRGVKAAREAGADVIVALGGGSALDAAKAVAGVFANGGEALDYMEVVGKGLPLAKPALPWIAVPTTGGTGAEATRNAVIAYPEKNYKASLRSPHLLAKTVVIDPELALSVSPEITARTGLDALCQLIEAYTSNGAQPMTDILAIDGIRRVARSLARAVENGRDLDAREDMAYAAFLSGVALANAGLGAAHGIAAPLGASVSVPHGAACGRLLPLVMRANIQALGHAENSAALERYAVIGRELTGRPLPRTYEAADAGAAAVERFVEAFQIPRLREFGLAAEQIPGIVALAKKASSMKFNPVSLTEADLEEILRKAL